MKLTAATLLVPLVVVAAAAGVQRDAVIARAQHVTGAWVYQRAGDPLARRITPGSELPPGAVIRPPRTATKPPATLVIVYDDNTVAEFVCPRDCGADLQLRTMTTAGSGWREQWALVQRLLWGNPGRYVTAITRGGGGVADAVIAVDAAGIDLAPAMTDVAPGLYLISTRPLAPGGAKPGAAVDHGDAEWRGQGPMLVAAAVQPGLYELEIRRRAPAELIGKSWVRIVARAQHDTAAASFAEARRSTESWRSAVSEADRRAFHRAWLDALGGEGR